MIIKDDIIDPNMEHVTDHLDNNNASGFKKFTSIEYLLKNKERVWLLGFIIRLMIAPWLTTTYDYTEFRIPIAQGLYNGGALYNDVNYNHMPIYPYLTWLMVSLVGFENEFLTSLAIKLPQIVADSLIPLVIYRIGVKLDKENIGLKASAIYALHPIPMYEILWATFHSIASLFLLLAFYFMLDDKPSITGIFLSLGFLTSQYPLFFFIIVGGYWLHHKKKIILSFLSFTLSTAIIVALVLVPNGTSLDQMLTDLRAHPSYQAIGQQCPRPILILINEISGISLDVLNIIAITLFLIFVLIPIYPMINKNYEVSIIDFIVYEMILLTIFFYCIHTKYILWLLPFIILWSVDRNDRFSNSTNIILVGYIFRRLFFYIPRDFWPNDIIFGFIGFIFAELIIGIIGFNICKQILTQTVFPFNDLHKT
ncbi:MAG: glycosyltransferase family 39 protein [Candidatus Heimdallarchaeota archaeon]|nr:glycosyltransferase family 39 protein [Candidatus Heimdallarchaeota archaeon]